MVIASVPSDAYIHVSHDGSALPDHFFQRRGGFFEGSWQSVTDLIHLLHNILHWTLWIIPLFPTNARKTGIPALITFSMGLRV
jgi:hypothetical protein